MKITQREMIKFQAEIMGDYKRARKCRICDHGLAHGPATADVNCQKCAMELKENRDK
jgi:hypothetical protein